MPETLSRRDWLKLSAASALGGSASGWFGHLAARAMASERKPVKSCILLWMAGGPAQSHTFDIKPGGDFKAIPTSVPGIQISEHLPQLAKQAQHLAILRSMKTADGNHPTARYLMHTGYRQGTGGGQVHPSLGAMVGHDIGAPESELPSFVAVGGTMGSGYLGPKYAPLIVDDFERGLPDLRPYSDDTDQRATLVEELDRAFIEEYQTQSARTHQTNFQRALALMKSGKTKAFELGSEPSAVRDAYGRNRFGQGCLLARRLVEVGVPFVEVQLNGWDTHQNANGRVKSLSEQLDPAFATLIADLKDRGLLDSTLIIWMGEFGRSPGAGSQHYAKAWTSVLAGGGLKTGQVIGDTGKTGREVETRPISAPDFFATVCSAVGIDTEKRYKTRAGRPMDKVEKTAKPVSEVLA